MKKALGMTLALTFAAASAAPAAQFEGRRDTVEALQSRADALVEGIDGFAPRIVIVPADADILTYLEYDMGVTGLHRRSATFMAEDAYENYGLALDPGEIEANILIHHHRAGFGGPTRTGFDPDILFATMLNAQGGNDHVCFSALLPEAADSRYEALNLRGLLPYQGLRGEWYAATHPLAPFDYHFETDLPPAAWDSFKQHYAMASCVLDMHIQGNASAPQSVNDFYLRQNAWMDIIIGYAAVMTARDGYPGMLSFLPDFMAATIHNANSYDKKLTSAQFVDKIHEIQSGQTTRLIYTTPATSAYHYPVPLLDALDEAWQRDDRLKTMTDAEIFNLLHNTADRYAANYEQTLALIDLRYPMLGNNLDRQWQTKLFERAAEGAADIDLCVTYSEIWREQGYRNGINYWQHVPQDVWQPPVCETAPQP